MRAGDDYFRAVTEFIFLRDEPRRADILCVPGSAREAHVLLAARLWREGYAPVVIPSGLHGTAEERFPVEGFPSEWAWMRSLLVREGVPAEVIFREDRATFTWQNALFTAQVCEREGIRAERGILACRPYHARRALTYYQAAFPDTVWAVCPADEPGLNADDWFRTAEGRAAVLGEVRRLGDQVVREVELLARRLGDGGTDSDDA